MTHTLPATFSWQNNSSSIYPKTPFPTYPTQPSSTGHAACMLMNEGSDLYTKNLCLLRYFRVEAIRAFSFNDVLGGRQVRTNLCAGRMPHTANILSGRSSFRMPLCAELDRPSLLFSHVLKLKSENRLGYENNRLR